jgi:hypothetical protein
MFLVPRERPDIPGDMPDPAPVLSRADPGRKPTAYGRESLDRKGASRNDPREDFPEGEDCPFCPAWAGKPGRNRR